MVVTRSSKEPLKSPIRSPRRKLHLSELRPVDNNNSIMDRPPNGQHVQKQSIKSHSKPKAYLSPGCINPLALAGDNSELKSNILSMLSKFYDKGSENPFIFLTSSSKFVLLYQKLLTQNHICCVFFPLHWRIRPSNG